MSFDSICTINAPTPLSFALPVCSTHLIERISSRNHIIACACLCVAHSPEFTLGFVESVTVLSTQRGKGYGRMLMEHLIAEARRLRVDRLHLTSNPKRVAANVLYQKLGFVRYDTNCYQLEFL